MPQIFHRSTNTFSKLSIFGAVFILAALAIIVTAINRSSYVTQAGVPREQPVPFSHQHHVGGIGIDCRYCHRGWEFRVRQRSADQDLYELSFSDLGNSPTEPVGRAFADKSIPWTRVHDLPDFAYFNHSIHVSKGIGCSTCHGRVDRMPLVWQEKSLQMEWCLDCHRHPERYVRPREEVFNMEYQSPPDQITLGAQLVKEYKIQSLTSCSTCHR
jgi:hypothetical protein